MDGTVRYGQRVIGGVCKQREGWYSVFRASWRVILLPNLREVKREPIRVIRVGSVGSMDYVHYVGTRRWQDGCTMEVGDNSY